MLVLKNNQLLTVDEAREYLRVGRNVMYSFVQTDLPHLKIGKQIRIPADDLAAWIKQQTMAVS